MTYYSGRALARFLEGMGLSPFNRHGISRLIVIITAAILLPVACAWLAANTGRWDLFERSGSIISAIGLLLASRRYVRHGVLELTMLHMDGELKSDVAEVLEDVITSKLGLGLSAFGSIIWGWGTYLGWWCFMSLAIWMIFLIRDGCRDFIHLRNRLASAPREQHRTDTDSEKPKSIDPAPANKCDLAASGLSPNGTDNRSLRSAGIGLKEQESA